MTTFYPDIIAGDEDDDFDELGVYPHAAEGCGEFFCSKCGFDMRFDEDGDDSWFEPEYPYEPRFNFCPNCGERVGSI